MRTVENLLSLDESGGPLPFFGVIRLGCHGEQPIRGLEGFLVTQQAEFVECLLLDGMGRLDGNDHEEW